LEISNRFIKTQNLGSLLIRI